jgi:3-dehydroquinate synthase
VGGARLAFVCVDSGMGAEDVTRACGSLERAGIRVTRHEVAGGERCKTFGELEHALVEMTRARVERSDVVVSIGGGAVCDLTGIAAATYRRGVPVVHCPTTVLAMVDASVGGKTGINLSVDGMLKKNMVGAFWQPRAVVADVRVLRTLPARELRAGLAECLKHGLLGGHAGDAGLFDWTGEWAPQLLELDEKAIVELVVRNVSLKAMVVSADEREETGTRALLNLGHTFGHVIEGIDGAKAEGCPPPLLHGECVGMGLIAAAVTAETAGIKGAAGLADRIRSTIRTIGLPVAVRGVPQTARLIELMHDDKKVQRGSLRLVLPISSGRAVVAENVAESAIEAGWDAIRTK